MILHDVFSADGLLKAKFPHYEIREGQVKMASLVEQALSSNTSAVIEGATGVGKGFAYLIPIIISGETVIVSTSNKSLQDQLDKKDLPVLQEVFGTPISWTVLKGKSNYFCHEHFSINQDEIKLELLRANKTEKDFDFTDADVIVQEIGKWAEEETTGDLEYCPIDLPSKVREMIGCDNDTVHEKNSEGYKFCFASKARQRAQDSQIVLVNHTLLALDIELRRKSEDKAGILPKTQAVVIDEAHEFEKAAILAFSDEISIFSLLHLLNWTPVKNTLSKPQYNSIKKALELVLRRYLPEKGQVYYSQKKVLKFEGLAGVADKIDTVIHVLGNIKASDEKSEAKLREVIKEAEHLQERMLAMEEEDDNMLRWAEAKDDRSGKPVIKLRSVPLDISNMLKAGLFSKKTVIACSATLSVNSKFDFFRQQVGMPQESLEMIVPSPFDYKEQALVYISDGQSEKVWEMQQLVRMSKGRAFILFTSYKDMRECYQMLDTPYTKMMQGEGGLTRAQLLEQFKTTKNGILFGTKSFWEGVDIKGEGLSLVIIHKVPFENPYDLVFSSKCEKIDLKAGKKVSFFSYAIPDACIKLKQGVGRLIRSTSDRGVIALLDARVTYKPYGAQIINCLPPAYRTQKLEKVEQFFNSIN